MSMPVSFIGRAALITTIGHTSCACSPKPTHIDISCEASCREGTAIPIVASVRDGKGHVLPLTVSWAVVPVTSGSVEGGQLRCHDEGKLSLRATAGISAVRDVVVTSPLAGTWLRQGDQYAGMRLQIATSTDGELSGYIVGPPDDSSLEFIKKDLKVGDERANSVLACTAHSWSPGIKKWNGIRRLTKARWSVADLSKELRVGRSSCDEDQKKSQYSDAYEITLVTADKLELRDLRINKAAQTWVRVVDVDDATIAVRKTNCEQALAAAGKAYANVVPGFVDRAREVASKFWNGNASLVEYQSTQKLAATLEAAQASLSRGAYQAKIAARALDAETSPPEIKQLREMSESMFVACKDTTP